MKILVTGCAGFIGSHVCEKLLERGDSVICIDNFDKYYDSKIKRRNIKECLANKNFKLYIEDIRNLDGIKKIFDREKLDKVIHLAAKAGVRYSLKEPYIYEEVNVKGTLNMLRLSKEFRIKNFIFGSSSSVYGANKKVPFLESDTTDNIVSPYASTKKKAELLCREFSKKYNMNITCLRFFTVYGPRNRPDMAISIFTKNIDKEKPINIFGDSNSKRDYTYVTDVVDGIISALDKNLKFEIINIGNSKPIELRHIIEIIERLLKKEAFVKKMPMQKGDVPITYADISKAKKLLAYKPKISIEEGIKRFVRWYKNAEKN